MKAVITARMLPVLFLVSSGPVALSAEYKASSAAEIAAVSEKLRPGDTLILGNGQWKDQDVVLKADGAAENPIPVRAETTGQVVLSGNSSITIDGQHLVVSGLLLKNVTGPGDAIAINGSHCRLTQCAIIDSTPKFYVHFRGQDNRMDHCYLAGKTSDHPTLQIEVDKERPNRHRIDHNHFGPRPPLGRNGGETIRVGYSHQSMSSSGTLVEHNLFDRCDRELEIISSKSCDNVYRFNTFLDCAGMLTLRHGNRCTVEGNFFLGHGKRGSGGIRVIGEDHVVVNNYIDSVTQGGFWITSGIPNSPLVGYFQSRNCLIAFNTMVNSPGPAIHLDAGIGASGRTLRPENITIANNLLSITDGLILKGEEGANFKWMGNLGWSSSATPLKHAGIQFQAPNLERAKDGILRPSADSPARAGAEGEFLTIKSDIDGQPRNGGSDSGCDQVSDAPASNRVLTPLDVGPPWLKPNSPEKSR